MSGWRAASRAAVQRMKDAKPEMPIEVEAQSLEQVDQALAAGTDIILVDNLPIDEITEAVRRGAGPRADRAVRAASRWSGCRRWPRPAPTTSRLAR